MNYGLYLSATGVLTNIYRQDVIANNLANVETVGFKRNIASFQQRLTEAQQRGSPQFTDPRLDQIGGGLFCSPTTLDASQGELEHTSNQLDVAIMGKGYFAVQDGGKTELTRDGRFMLDDTGNLILSNASASRVLNPAGEPISLPGYVASAVEIGKDGTITAHGKAIGRLGVFDIPDSSQLVQEGGNLLSYPDLTKKMTPIDPNLRNGFVERSNVDPATELTTLMEAQRQLEANANMIRYQDQTMGRCVNDVGKIG